MRRLPDLEFPADRSLWLRALFVALAFVGTAVTAAAAEPRPPYWSVEIATVATESAAQAALKPFAHDPYARAEKRNSGYIVRVGAWQTRAEAEAAQKDFQGRGLTGTRLRQIEHPAPWIVAQAAPAPKAAPRPVVAPPPSMAAAAPAAVTPAPMVASAGDLTDLSLSELMNVKVTSVSKHAEPVLEAPAAIFVISGEEIRRSGVRTLAEALRRVPGLQVARNNNYTYTITSRGFSGDKLEVRVDGRSVYSPLTSTVFWDVLDTYLADIDRIEVIRGPGATLWGANAVNGVINIVTRNSKDTLGTEVQVGAGSEEKTFGAARTGARLGEDASIRLYGKAFERDAALLYRGGDAPDGFRLSQAGFRMDAAPTKHQDVMFTGDVYDGHEDAAGLTAGTVIPVKLNGGNLNARWTDRLESAGELSVQAYYDAYTRAEEPIFAESRQTYDLEVEHRFEPFERNNAIYGVGYRSTHDSTAGPPTLIVFNPESRTLQTFSAFLQDQAQLTDALELTVGSKFEHNSYTGFEIQPSIRLGWTLDRDWYTWASVSRAVRTPNRLDEDVAIFCSTLLNTLGFCAPVGSTPRIGNPNLDSEKVLAYEWGLRFWQERQFSADLETFYNDYRDLRGTETAPAPFGSFQNSIEGHSFGGELALGWQPLDWLSTQAYYGFLKIDLHAKPGSTDAFTAMNTEGSSPVNTAGLRVSMQPLPKTSVDTLLRYVDNLPALGVPAYTELYMRLGYRLLPSLDLGLVGQNLLDSRHPEYGRAASPTATKGPTNEIERSVLAEIRWSWQ